MYYGHREIVESLTGELPPVSIFIGPDSVGKMTLAEAMAVSLATAPWDRFTMEKLTAETADEIVMMARFAPFGHNKVIIIRINGYTTRATLNILLLALENHHPVTKFILISNKDLPETIVTRGKVFRFGLLDEDSLTSILVQLRKVREDQARLAAAKGQGQVSKAVDALYKDLEKTRVLGVLRAFRERDTAILDRAADDWTEGDNKLLAVWARESLTGCWRVFSEAESEIPGKTIPLKILMALRANVRPRLMVRSNLMTVLRNL